MCTNVKPLTEGVSIGIGELWILASLTLGKFTLFTSPISMTFRWMCRFMPGIYEEKLSVAEIEHDAQPQSHFIGLSFLSKYLQWITSR